MRPFDIEGFLAQSSSPPPPDDADGLPVLTVPRVAPLPVVEAADALEGLLKELRNVG